MRSDYFRKKLGSLQKQAPGAAQAPKPPSQGTPPPSTTGPVSQPQAQSFAQGMQSATGMAGVKNALSNAKAAIGLGKSEYFKGKLDKLKKS